MYWNGASMVAGYWINEKAGWVPKFYNDKAPETSNYDFKFPLSNSLHSGASSYLMNFNV